MTDGTILLATFGTLGDIHPFIAIAKALRRRGLSPVIATSPMYRASIEAEGVAFKAMRPDNVDIARALGIDVAEVFRRVVRSPYFIIDEIYLRFLAQTFADVSAAAVGAGAIVSHSLLVGANLAAEKSGLPTLRIALSPIHLQSALAPSLTPPVPYVLAPRWAHQRGVNCVLREILRHRLSLKMRPVAGFRREVGLAASKEDLYLNCGRPTAADAVVGLYSPHFAPLERDHASDTQIVGFPFDRSRSAAQVALPDALKAFLAAGPRPIVFTLGSFAVEASGSFYEVSLAAARRLGRRAILLTGVRHAERLSHMMADDVFVAAYAPHDAVFPFAAAIVHHGGMGTTAEALRSGRPQLVVPFFGDQPDHAARVERLGAGRALSPRRYDCAGAAAAIGAILAPKVVDRAARLAERLADEDGAAEVAAIVESMLTARLQLAG